MSNSLYNVGEPSEAAIRAVSYMQVGPEKPIRSEADMLDWVHSRSYYDLVAYINNTSLAIQGKRITSDFPVTEQLEKLCSMFNCLEELIYLNPPQSSELGHQAYRSWSRQMHQKVFIMLDKAMIRNCRYVGELGQYLSLSFGSSMRVDYGHGHELMFMFFLCGLFKAEILVSEDTVAAALLLFGRYNHLMRRLIQTYHMEPTVSRGDWGIDEYCMIPYLWGAAQLGLEAPFTPVQCELEENLKTYRHDYLLVECLDDRMKLRVGVLGEHSFELWCLLSMSSWAEVYKTLIECYLRDVMGDFQFVQHATFTDLMSFCRLPDREELRVVRLGVPLRSARSTAEFQEDTFGGITYKNPEDHEHPSHLPPVTPVVSRHMHALMRFQDPDKLSDRSGDVSPKSLVSPRSSNQPQDKDGQSPS
ncbi:serine/threonine-protein phosphatase 2A activator-like [Scaptodrosophila lebanonensis]|uniref:Serine/threonine-protein phosphatase 2A activator n=1 Tax=Drosophila lebanonensis TaxID=7225 RepID=A0A6J2T5Y8_DROLE|nr:serine/threonine-protein phosphatase 2A activator-like [Scaptodrosophila lebanonensis]